MKQPFLRNSLLMLAAVGMATAASPALAHEVQIDYILNERIANQSDETLELRTTFSSGEPLKGAKVTVFAPDQSFSPYLTGVTDDQGRFSFNPDDSVMGAWEVTVERAGHSDILEIPVTRDGIDVDAVSRSIEGQEDIHYGSSPLMAVGSVAVAAACLGFAVSRKKIGKRSA